MSDDFDDEQPRNNHYATPLAPQFELQLSTGTVKSVDGVMRLTDREKKELNKLIRSGRVDIAQNVVELDYAKAEQVAKDYLARQPVQGKAGPANSLMPAEKNTDLKPAPQTIGKDVQTASGMSLAERIRAKTGEGNGGQVIEEDAVHLAADKALEEGGAAAIKIEEKK